MITTPALDDQHGRETLAAKSSPSKTPLTVVMPAYNEEGAIAEAVTEVIRQVLDAIPGADLVVVNDGSRDHTGAILDQLAANEDRLNVVHQPNGGHGAAILRGLDESDGVYVFLMDSDRQIPIEAFAGLWEAARDRDGAFGIRVQRHDPKIRLALTRVIRAAIRLLFGVAIRDANIPFKVVRRSIWLEARPLIPEGTLAPSLFLALYCRKRGCDIAELEVPHLERQTGVVSIRRWKLFKFCARAFGQLLAFRRRLGR